MRIDFTPIRQFIPLAAATAGVGAVKEGVEFVDALIQRNKNERELSKLKQPFFKVQSEYEQNKNIAGSLGGLPGETKDYLTDQANLGLGTGINAIQEQGGSANDVAKFFQGFDRSISRIGAEDAQARVDNIKYFMNVNKDLAGQKTSAFLVNELQPYEQKLKQLTQNISNARSNMSTAANNFIGAGSAIATAYENEDLMAKLFPDQQPQGRTRISDPVELAGGSVPQAGMGGVGQRRSPNANYGGNTQEILDKYIEIENILKRGGQ